MCGYYSTITLQLLRGKFSFSITFTTKAEVCPNPRYCISGLDNNRVGVVLSPNLPLHVFFLAYPGEMVGVGGSDLAYPGEMVGVGGSDLAYP